MIDRPVAPVEQVDVGSLPIDRFAEVLDAEQEEAVERTVARSQELLAGRVVWNLNSTAYGGGVAEMLRSLIAYARAAGADARWLVMGGEPDFFRITKRLHNNLHGYGGDGGPLGDAERQIYEAVSAATFEQIRERIQPGDIVLAHDPQTAGLVQPLVDLGAHVIWRAHIGLDGANARVRVAWSFLRPYVSPAAAYVFSRREFAWDGLDPERLEIIRPSIDPFSAKNQEIEDGDARAILAAAAIVAHDGPGRPVFMRHDGTPGRVERQAEMIQDVPVPPDRALVTQISRWDRLKDPIGVIEGLVAHSYHPSGAHLVLAGPEPSSIADDPEGAGVLRDVIARWESLAPEVRVRIHLALLPMQDAEENAAIVNALQRRATVVVQKSIAEGFGLTVAEAMWKARPVVAGRVGGIQDQIVDGRSGVLVDPRDIVGFGAVLRALVLDEDRRARLGAAAQERVRAEFLGVRHLTDYVGLFEQVIQAAESKETVR